MAIFVLASLPDLHDKKTKRRYRNHLVVTCLAISIVHITWVLLKASNMR
jgi:hypothetical protein